MLLVAAVVSCGARTRSFGRQFSWKNVPENAIQWYERRDVPWIGELHAVLPVLSGQLVTHCRSKAHEAVEQLGTCEQWFVTESVARDGDSYDLYGCFDLGEDKRYVVATWAIDEGFVVKSGHLGDDEWAKLEGELQSGEVWSLSGFRDERVVGGSVWFVGVCGSGRRHGFACVAPSLRVDEAVRPEEATIRSILESVFSAGIADTAESEPALCSMLVSGACELGLHGAADSIVTAMERTAMVLKGGGDGTSEMLMRVSVAYFPMLGGKAAEAIVRGVQEGRTEASIVPSATVVVRALPDGWRGLLSRERIGASMKARARLDVFYRLVEKGEGR